MWSFKQIDWVTNTVWLLFYAVSLLLFLAFFWKDYINDFRSQNATYRREEILVSETHKQYISLLTQKNNYEKDHSLVLQKISNPISSSNLQAIFSGSPNIKALENKHPATQGIQESLFQVSGVVKNTQELKKILHTIQNGPYAMEIDFPIEFKKTKKGLQYLIGIKAFSKIDSAYDSFIPQEALPDSIQQK